jgi:hypothetical protein
MTIQPDHTSDILAPKGPVTTFPLSRRDQGSIRAYEVFTFGFPSNADMDSYAWLNRLLLDAFPFYKVYFVYVEAGSRPKTAIRSHRKYFYAHRSWLSSRAYAAVEIDSGSSESFMAGLVHVEPSNLNAVWQHLGASNLRFIYLVKKGTRSFSENTGQFLQAVGKAAARSGKTHRLDVLEVVARWGGKNKHIMQILHSGNDSVLVQLYAHKADKNLSGLLLETSG